MLPHWSQFMIQLLREKTQGYPKGYYCCFNNVCVIAQEKKNIFKGGNPVIYLPFGDGFYNPFMVILGIVSWVYHIRLFYEGSKCFKVALKRSGISQPPAMIEAALKPPPRCYAL